MKAKIHVSTKDFCFKEIEIDGQYSENDVLEIHDKLQILVNEKDGVSASHWVEIRKTPLNTGEFDLNRLEELSKLQRYWINQTKLGLRSINKE